MRRGSESLQKTRAGPSHMPCIPICCVKFKRVFVCEGKRKSFIHTNSQSRDPQPPNIHTHSSLFRDCHGDVLTAVKCVIITPVSQVNSNKIQCLPFMKDRDKCHQVYLNTFFFSPFSGLCCQGYCRNGEFHWLQDTDSLELV